ncbi:phospholipase A [Aliikangiella sp. IMCC44359]|uniref:phospholipase A n=1 Tax=Aliikangiella sp. IMCC44359 TaxID=3459125 RepID=UPI00403AEC16
MKQSHLYILIVFVGLTSNVVLSHESDDSLEECYLEQLNLSEEKREVGEIRAWCQKKLEQHIALDVKEKSPLEQRIINEAKTQDSRNVITPHMRNYMLPVTYIRKPNEEPYKDLPGSVDELDNVEAKFQMSFKAPIFKSLVVSKDILYFGFTIQSYWQMYNRDASSPFRETNYQPEIFYGFMNDLEIGGWTNRVNIIGVEHQSNGRSQPLSRSWNRVYANFMWESDKWLVGFKPWYRLPEDEKESPNSPEGDDNPDINKYMGYFEFTTAYKWDEQTFGMMFRNNLRSNNRGAIQLDWTFPMGDRFKGYAQYFNGYGESLIDYNQSIERFGVGILLTDLF